MNPDTAKIKSTLSLTIQFMNYSNSKQCNRLSENMDAVIPSESTSQSDNDGTTE